MVNAFSSTIGHPDFAYFSQTTTACPLKFDLEHNNASVEFEWSIMMMLHSKSMETLLCSKLNPRWVQEDPVHPVHRFHCTCRSATDHRTKVSPGGVERPPRGTDDDSRQPLLVSFKTDLSISGWNKPLWCLIDFNACLSQKTLYGVI